MKAASQELRPRNRRFEGFSDGVFATAVTIMVFEIRIPERLAFTSDPDVLRPFAVLLITYAFSFFVIVNLWSSHRYLVATLTNPTRTTIWLNSLLLFCVTLVPMATRFLGLNPMSSRAAAIYASVGVACTVAFMFLRSHASRVAPNEIHRGIHLRVLRVTWFFLAIYAVAIPLAFVSPWLAWACFLVVPVMVFLLPALWVKPDHAMSSDDRGLQRSCP